MFVLLKLAMQRYKIGSGTIFATRWTPAARGEQQGQVRWLEKGDVNEQVRFISITFGLAA